MLEIKIATIVLLGQIFRISITSKIYISSPFNSFSPLLLQVFVIAFCNIYLIFLFPFCLSIKYSLTHIFKEQNLKFKL